MTVRQQSYTPNTILYANEIQATADNGIVQIDSVSELDQVGSGTNLAFCKSDYEMYKRIAEGTGGLGVCWEVF
jgi:hypothetical protein